MKKPSVRSRLVDFFYNNPGEHKTADIAKAIGASVSTTSTGLSKLTKEGKIKKIQQGTYTANDSSTSISQQRIKKNIDELREAEANKETIDRLLNIYDSVLGNFETWVANSVGSHTDFGGPLPFLDNFKGLTAIGDKLMKRRAIEHQGYDTNTRQAQEDAKAKTAEREEAALKDAPIEEQVNVIGSFDLDTKQLIDNFPTLESITETEEKEIKV